LVEWVKCRWNHALSTQVLMTDSLKTSEPYY
jgi:hypothetical protein